MRRTAFIVLTVLAGLLVTPALGLTAASATPPPPFAVSGDGVGTYPAIDPDVTRYAITTTEATGGSVTVTVPPGSSVDGTPASGDTTVTGLTEGDEIAVEVGGRSYGLIYLPSDFPTLTVTTHQPGLAPGYIGLGLTTFGPGAVFDTLIDRNGVPVWIHRGIGSDLKRQPNGDLTTFRPTTSGTNTGSDLVTLDEQFNEVRRQHVGNGLTNTDNHDAELLPDGSTILIGYEPRGDPVTGYLDPEIQKVDGDGQVVFQWSGQGLEAETLNPLLWPPLGDQRIDYAHINSIEEIADGTHDLLVSFRHFSAVYRIATVAHDGYAQGDIVWRLGGRHSDFTFVDDPDHGPCAQHTAHLLLDQADGHDHLIVLDNGSGPLGQSAAGCVDPNNTSGPGIERLHTRIAEWSLDTGAHTATLVWTYQPTISDPTPRDPFSFFAGSARRLGNGDTLVGWADERAMLATEVDAAKNVLWQVQTPDTGTHTTRYTSYRASLVSYTDAIDPAVTTDQTDDAVYVLGDTVTPTFHCTDQGGSNLQTCATSGLASGHVDTGTPGPHTWQVTATDGAGNTTVVTRHYTVRSGRQPDGLIRKAGHTWWKGDDVYGAATDQTVTQHARRTHTRTSFWRVQNDGERADTFALTGTARTERFRVRYFADGLDVTGAVVAGSYRTPTLAPGEWVGLRIEVTPTRRAPIGGHRTVTLHAASTSAPDTGDRVATEVIVRG